MICRHCGKEFSDNARYCIHCGQAVAEETNKAEKVQRKNCWNCGAVNPNDAKFCAECGEKQDVNKLLVRIGGEIAKKRITTICPKCHSRNIKIYRKGYDYGHGFWGAIFGVRGAGYAAGFDSNKACCRCMNCGKDWETDYDYRLINK